MTSEKDQSILEAAKAQFAAKRELKEIEVPEWGGSIFYYVPPSVRERSRVLECYDRHTSSFSPDTAAVCFMARARDKNGHRLFSDVGWEREKAEVLDKYDPDVVDRVVREMGGFLSALGTVTIEDAEKN